MCPYSSFACFLCAQHVHQWCCSGTGWFSKSVLLPVCLLQVLCCCMNARFAVTLDNLMKTSQWLTIHEVPFRVSSRVYSVLCFWWNCRGLRDKSFDCLLTICQFRSRVHGHDMADDQIEYLIALLCVGVSCWAQGPSCWAQGPSCWAQGPSCWAQGPS